MIRAGTCRTARRTSSGSRSASAPSAFAADAGRAGVLVRPFAGEGVRVSVGETEATDLLLDVTADWVGRRSA